MLLLPDLAPMHVNRIKTLVRAGFYNGMPISRVIEGFMAQTGDPVRETGVEYALLPRLNAEFHSLPFERGVVGMARSRSPHSACHQFFITSGRSRCLDQKYTAVGWVTSGMELIDQLPKGNPVTGKVAEPGIIKNMQIVRT
jgi:Peptidyl-prolyl cis-trans isomerase (rotamase) - cyclophilin family